MALVWIIIITVIAFIVYSGFRKKKPDTSNVLLQQQCKGSALDIESKGKAFLPPIPAGFQIAEQRLSVAGVHYRKDAALKFVSGSGQTLDIEREPENPNDPNAIKMFGVSDGFRYFIGYMPAVVAAQIVSTGLFEAIRPRLDYISVSSNGYIDIIFQVLCPKDKIKQYRSFVDNKPASTNEKEFYKFFGIKIPKGLTTGEAKATITKHKKQLFVENKAKLDEWNAYEDELDAYEEICDEFDDRDFRDSYDLKLVNRKLLNDALKELKQEGTTFRALADDIDIVVEKIIALKPDIEKKGL